MLFSVIYSFTCDENLSVKRYQPPRKQLRKKLWDCTEGDDLADYKDCFGERAKHRKYCALLPRKDFDEFIEWCGLRADSTETMGSLGAPGFGFGWAPAIAFNSNDEASYASAYVTPIPEIELRRDVGDDVMRERWERIKKAVIKVYG